jgi:hypothetical protein
MKAPDCIFRLDPHTRFLQGQALPSTRSRGQIVPRVIVLIDLCRAGISHLQRLPASITRRGFQSKGDSLIQSLAMARRT